jgi:hypothetical protein
MNLNRYILSSFGARCFQVVSPALFRQVFMYIFNRLGASIYSKVRQNDGL